MDYAYKRVRSGTFRNAIEAVERAARAHGFVVCRVHDIRGALEAKGFRIRPLSILELEFEGDGDADPTLSLLNPVNVNVYEEGEGVWVAALRPTLFCQVYPEHELDTAAAILERQVVAVVDEATAVTP